MTWRRLRAFWASAIKSRAWVFLEPEARERADVRRVEMSLGVETDHLVIDESVVSSAIVGVVSSVFQMLVWFSPDLIPFHLLMWQLVIGCTDSQI